ncbi:hypothetical protein FQN53_008812 [Emmonsiellopsis sp. PD_33]|nr:hypothetical protein FQN53_008812 [Emmonsiellopsis sp. PD_33]KAK2797352.1 hypothetical protein FQN51_008523 [Onygenales sp. PD_10]
MGGLGRLFTSLSVLVAATSGFAAPTSDDATTLEKRNNEPCKLVADVYAEQFEDNPDGPYWISAKLAHECLLTVPIDRGDALRLVDGLTSFWKWQSTIDFLKDTPEGYLLPETDLIGELKKIRDNVSKGKYDGEYEFQYALASLARSTYDGHFNLALDAASVFLFRRSRAGPLVSISEDGTKTPKIYSFHDLNTTEPHYSPSAIKTIDGVGAEEWLRKQSYEGGTQDPDALYNELFYSIPGETGGSFGGFYTQFGVYTGDTITFGFENGTETEYENRATFTSPFTGVVNGQSFYDKFCSEKIGNGFKKGKRDLPTEEQLTRDVPKVVRRALSDNNPRPLYPSPIVDIESGNLAGYFPGGDHKDVAVLSSNSFSSEGKNGSVEWQSATSDFLAACKSEGKKKLIVDVTGNGGGTLMLGYDLFKQIVPDYELDDSFNIRAHEQLDIIGSKITDLLNDNKETPEDEQEKHDIYDIDSYTDVNNKEFDKWDDFYGPESTPAGYKFSHLGRWNMNNKPSILRSSGGIVMSGYLDRANVVEKIFKVEDIVLVTDGICGSTCALFANLMQKAGVRTIAVGGRSREGPMQAIGGVKGAQVLNYQQIFETITTVFDDYATPQEKRQWENTDLGEIYRTGEYILARTLSDGVGGRVNFRNAIDPKDKSRTPLQFVYEPAGCRMWFTRESKFDMNKFWAHVSKVAFGDASCLPGSTPS